MIYIITRSEQYYPTGGTSDWEKVFRADSDDEARQEYAKWAEKLTRYQFSYLIVIREDASYSILESD